MDNDNVGDYCVPVDPMDELQCESCQLYTDTSEQGITVASDRPVSLRAIIKALDPRPGLRVVVAVRSDIPRGQGGKRGSELRRIGSIPVLGT